MCLCNFMSLRTSSVNITQMQVEKYSNKKKHTHTQLLLTWNLCRLMLTFVGFLFFSFYMKKAVVYMGPCECVYVCPVTVATFVVQSISPHCIALDSILVPSHFPLSARNDVIVQ